MYTQFFGNYLLEEGYINQEQLFAAMQKQSETRMRLGTLAIHAGYMTAEEVDAVVNEQMRMDKKFGEIAIDAGYLTSDQVLELLKAQSPDFLLLGQILVDENVISNADLERIIVDYRSTNELTDLDMTAENREAFERIFENFFIASETPVSKMGQMYCELLFNNFIRFIGDDFTPLTITECDAFPFEKCVSQQVNGEYSLVSYITMDEPTAVAFASRYGGETYEKYDEYVQASLEDFLNLHNGLFIVNVSNETSIELSITAPEAHEEPLKEFYSHTFDFPVLYSFGTVHFIIEMLKPYDI